MKRLNSIVRDYNKKISIFTYNLIDLQIFLISCNLY